MSTYLAWQPTLQPAGLRGQWGERWGAVLGAEKDALLGLAKDAVLARFLPTAPSDALSLLGADRQIGRESPDTESTYRARLAGAWESWAWVGTRYGIALGVGLLGEGYPAVIPYRELPWDSATDRWARIRILFTGFAGWTGEPFGGAWSWGSRLQQPIESETPATIRPVLRRVLRQWINARDRVFSVTIARGAAVWGLFLWGSDTWSVKPVSEWSAPLFGEDDTIWGAVAFGVFC